MYPPNLRGIWCGELGRWRARVGDYRIVYTVDDDFSTLISVSLQEIMATFHHKNWRGARADCCERGHGGARRGLEAKHRLLERRDVVLTVPRTMECRVSK